MKAPYVQLVGLERAFDRKTRVVDGVTLDIQKGEFVSFLGPSGSGKTTTLMMIAGFEHPDVGSIRLGGKDITRVPPWKRNVGVVFQNYALFPHMTVQANVAFPLRMRKMAAQSAAELAQRALEMVGLTSLGNRYPATLSGGQQQRVALARGIVFEPTLLLLDEPLSALDKNLREALQLELKRIHREIGVTMIYVTHDQTEAMTLSDRICVFRDGRIEQSGTPLDVYEKPRTRFVAEFIGDNNLLDLNSYDEQRGEAEVQGLGFVRVAKRNAQPVEASRTLLLRPEELSLTLPDVPQERPVNSFAFLTENIIQHGSDCIVIGRSGGLEQRLRVRASNQAVARVAGHQEITISWPFDSGFVV